MPDSVVLLITVLSVFGVVWLIDHWDQISHWLDD